MSYFFSRYKFYKSFKIPILSEDKLSIEVEEMVDCEKYAKMIIKDVNLAYISIISDNKFNENDQVKLCISHKKLLKTKRYRFEASIIGSHMNHELNKYIIVIEVNNQEYSDFVLSFIEGFKKKRLKKYLMQSALENKEYDIEEISEIIALMKNGFHSLIKKDDINLNHLLDNCNKFLKSSDSSLYLINSSDNVLERKNTTIKMPSINKIDYRKGIPGIVFSSAELINIYKSKLISLCPANESAPESVLAAPIFNRHKKVIGVLEFINKNEGKRFDLNDEATISMLSLVFSSFFQLYNPVHSTSKIRTFNPSLNKENLKIIEDEMHKDTLPHY